MNEFDFTYRRLADFSPCCFLLFDQRTKNMRNRDKRWVFFTIPGCEHVLEYYAELLSIGDKYRYHEHDRAMPSFLVTKHHFQSLTNHGVTEMDTPEIYGMVFSMWESGYKPNKGVPNNAG